jgi:hypothetical protein
MVPSFYIGRFYAITALMLLLRSMFALLATLALLGASGCALAPPVRPWQRGHLARRAMQFDDGLEARFRQHLFGAREGAEGGYGHVGGGCGCN